MSRINSILRNWGAEKTPKKQQQQQHHHQQQLIDAQTLYAHTLQHAKPAFYAKRICCETESKASQRKINCSMEKRAREGERKQFSLPDDVASDEKTHSTRERPPVSHVCECE